MAVSIPKLKKQLMERIDVDDLMQVEKVERYIQHVESYRRMDATIKKEGESVITVNASQTFVKAHPLLTERNKANAALLSIEKSFGFAPEIEEEPTRSADDLI
ncbi:P27 family phage terminase small subunit [Oceanobacillus sp. FSL K6-0251]|uniref:P27 family phage terminase small subunit n=1 Tax=Oceanobacillus sp. FSL K6-0251 TaxID=2921602 RepID=UPI0030F530F8